jgi:prophage antirepressor-like protein
VCKALGIAQPASAARSLDTDEKSTVQITHGASAGSTNATVVSESGLYAIIMQSRKPEAKRFRKWVTSEVLPSIRKTGGMLAAFCCRPDS